MTQKNITLGTAGHIDHGKTALIKNLTGCDTDFLKQEKERGMSIELGFAPCKLADLEVGVVDVPGHENFIKTMVAGATGIDAVIFVIAADDGVMPQTREHLDILSLLGVTQGVVALTKVDIVTAERVHTVTTEIKDYLHPTFLKDAPIFPLSSITGLGFGEFYDGLKDLVAGLTPKQTDGVFRLPVERTFSVKGYGTVVSGIPVSGSARVGDKIMLYPRGLSGRIKAIQVYQAQSDRVQCGQCAAINVAQWDHHAVTRGDVMTVEGYFEPSEWYLCQLNLLPGEGLTLKNGAQVKFHTGTSETTATVFLMAGNRALGSEQVLIQIRLNHALVAGPTDRFIIRSLSPVQTMGGGTVVEALGQKLRRSRPEVLADAMARAQAVPTNLGFVEYCIRAADTHATTRKAVAQRTKQKLETLEPLIQTLIDTGRVQAVSTALLIHTDTAEALKKGIVAEVSHYHDKEPASPGMETEACVLATGLAKPVFQALARQLIEAQILRAIDTRLALANHNSDFDPVLQKRMQQVEALFEGQAFHPPKPMDVMNECRLNARDTDDIIRLLIQHKKLVRVDRDMYFHAHAIEEARRRAVAHLHKEGSLQSVDFKYMLDTTRKFAIPLLDYFDNIAVTRRAPDNTRCLGRHA
ncbi:MAG: selenocysteine-specific translation elongation factor [Phycisphaerae bacterium]|nr:selenocysteine-specific translation elongation factor [Phycisphaerae bacterium]